MIEKGTVIIDLNEYDKLKNELFELKEENERLGEVARNAKAKELSIRFAVKNIIKEETEKALEVTKSLHWDKKDIKRHFLDTICEKYKDLAFVEAFIDSLIDEHMKAREENE